MTDFGWPFKLDFDLASGLCKQFSSTKRYLSDMKGMYLDEDTRIRMQIENNQLVYEFFEPGTPEQEGDVAFGTSIVYPGMVGREYFMTNGHFHNRLETAEVYICLRGEGYMMQENPEGEWDAVPLKPGVAVYCPKRFAHRSINIGTEPLVTFYALRGDAGHNYGIIKDLGFSKLIVRSSCGSEIIDNEKRKNG